MKTVVCRFLIYLIHSIDVFFYFFVISVMHPAIRMELNIEYYSVCGMERKNQQELHAGINQDHQL